MALPGWTEFALLVTAVALGTSAAEVMKATTSWTSGSSLNIAWNLCSAGAASSCPLVTRAAKALKRSVMLDASLKRW